ncbi:unnamed protein product [Musa hybrid cultivar]
MHFSAKRESSFGFAGLSALFYLAVFRGPTPSPAHTPTHPRPHTHTHTHTQTHFSRLSTQNKKSSPRSFLPSLPSPPIPSPLLRPSSTTTKGGEAHDDTHTHTRTLIFIHICQLLRGLSLMRKNRLLSTNPSCCQNCVLIMFFWHILLMLPEVNFSVHRVQNRVSQKIRDFCSESCHCYCSLYFHSSDCIYMRFFMEQNMDLLAGKGRKRKAKEEAHAGPAFFLDELNQDLLERVLSCLPASSFFRLSSVCKRWRSVATSETFHIACSQILRREPWFLMVDHDLDQFIVFDTSERNWKSLNHQTHIPQSHSCKPIPVAASGGLVCYRTDSGNFLVFNLLTGSCRELPPGSPDGESQTLHAIAMYSSPTYPSSFKIILVLGKSPNLAFRIFDSTRSTWEDEVMLIQKGESSSESHIAGDEIIYFLSKAGDVVATNMQRSASKQYSSVLIMENGELVIYFLSESGTVVACNLAQKTFFEYPRFLPIYFEYSIDVVECKGEMLVVVLSEFLETASLRVWKFSKESQSWQQVAAMPPSMSHEFYGQKMDINCTGCQEIIFICASSSECSRHIMFDMAVDEWVELPKCYVDGKAKEFTAAISFEPRPEATV